jgi:hypothetical protein
MKMRGVTNVYRLGKLGKASEWELPEYVKHEDTRGFVFGESLQKAFSAVGGTLLISKYEIVKSAKS